MDEQAQADAVWNRACMGPETARAPGDLAMEAMIVFHGATMNGGMLHAVECLPAGDLEAAKRAYHYFGFDNVAALIDAAQAALRLADCAASLEGTLDGQYHARIPDDTTLVSAFESHYRQNPGNYGPLARD